MVETTGTEYEITGGVDTHIDTHTAAALDGLGHLLGHQRFPTTAAGYAHLLAWLTGWGSVVAVGIEGTGSYGAGLARHLTASGIGDRRGRPPGSTDAPQVRQVRSGRRCCRCSRRAGRHRDRHSEDP